MHANNAPPMELEGAPMSFNNEKKKEIPRAELAG
jgi:hypothetical protein